MCITVHVFDADLCVFPKPFHDCAQRCVAKLDCKGPQNPYMQCKVTFDTTFLRVVSDVQITVFHLQGCVAGPQRSITVVHVVAIHRLVRRQP